MIRVSLREMFVLVAVVALAIVSLITASPAVANDRRRRGGALGHVAPIVSLVDHGPRRAFAIGFAVGDVGLLARRDLTPTTSCTGHQFTGDASANVELDAYDTAACRPRYFCDTSTPVSAHLVFRREQPANRSPNRRAKTSDDWRSRFGQRNFRRRAADVRRRASSSARRPTGRMRIKYARTTNNFMAIGHFWWALLFGYVGGHFARFVYSAARSRSEKRRQRSSLGSLPN